QPVRSNLIHLSGLYDLVVTADNLPEPLRSRLTDGIDSMLVAYIDRYRIIEKLDDAGDSLRHRAIRLMQLCAPGILTSPRALALVRQRVIGHL
ncbi:hypothetical protein ACSTLL_23480, partial [Vibrio parahaemolyticus]